MKLVSKIIALFGIIIATAFLGGVGFFVIDTYAIPKLSNNVFFSNYSIFKKATENTTIINRTDQVMIQEDDAIEKVSSQAVTTTVTILSETVTDKKKTAIQVVAPATQSMRGSGVFVTNDGMIVTYRKAILENNATYKVITFNGTVYNASLMGIDNFTNLAYLRIQDTVNVSAISFANSQDVRAGKKMIAIANGSEDYKSRFSIVFLNSIDKTFNLSEKTVSSSEKLEGVLDVDFSDQKDYVGGPVIDFNGEMVGLVAESNLDNKQQYFLIPSNVIRDSLNTAIRNDFDNRAVLGLYYVSINKEVGLLHHLDRDHGALVYGKPGLIAIAGSAADKAGFQADDIITFVGDKEVNLDNPLSNIVRTMQKGSTVEFTVIRNGVEKKIGVSF